MPAGRLVLVLLPLATLGVLRSADALGVVLDPGRPTELHRGPSAPGGKSAWIIRAAAGGRGAATAPSTNRRIPSYDLGCAGRQCTYIISAPEGERPPPAAPFNRERVHSYLSNYETILEQARNVTSKYVVQKLEPDTRFPTPMEAYQRDRQQSLEEPPATAHHGRPTGASSAWPAPAAPPRPPYPTRHQGYVTMRPTYRDRYPGRDPTRHDRPSDRFEVRRGVAQRWDSARPDSEGFHSSTRLSKATNPPVIMYRSMRRPPSAPAAAERRARQLSSATDTPGKMLARRVGGQAPTTERRHSLETGDHRLFSGKIFQAHLKSGPITVLGDEELEEPSQDLQEQTDVDGRQAVSRGRDGTALITTDEGHRKVPNVMMPPLEGQQTSPGHQQAGTQQARDVAAAYRRVRPPGPVHRTAWFVAVLGNVSEVAAPLAGALHESQRVTVALCPSAAGSPCALLASSSPGDGSVRLSAVGAVTDGRVTLSAPTPDWRLRHLGGTAAHRSPRLGRVNRTGPAPTHCLGYRPLPDGGADLCGYLGETLALLVQKLHFRMVWALVLALAPAAAALRWLTAAAERRCRLPSRRQRWSPLLLESVALLSGQGVSARGAGAAGRTLVFFLYVVTVTLAAVYAGNLTAFLSLPRWQPPLDSLEQLADSDVQPHVVRGHTTSGSGHAGSPAPTLDLHALRGAFFCWFAGMLAGCAALLVERCQGPCGAETVCGAVLEDRRRRRALRYAAPASSRPGSDNSALRLHIFQYEIREVETPL
ncbi:hypothetical protein FJT64_014971 [Amphibalanus amphitrite]|uniref:Ionotropic glutamate receptor C-terminal domain-containing protein n=1 Tax=Amphibalanus amphitrite TaxID=1232801 RepID=A0A6A4XF07_AMPAM|nr:hypothetical protein FJT64_014971 [Amphibalanus amphitrite]